MARVRAGGGSMFVRTATYALGLVALCAIDAGAQEGPLSLSRARLLARQHAPMVIAARGRLAEARAAGVGAAMRRSNPELEGSAGPRWGGDSVRQLDFGAGISQALENGALRRARIAVAAEGRASADAEVVVAEQGAIREASLAFLDVQWIERRAALMREAAADAVLVQQAAERRFALGDVAMLDVNAARIERARRDADIRDLEARRLEALGRLASLVGLPVVSAIVDEAPPPPPAEIDRLLAAVDARPELRAIDAGIRRAQAQLQLASAAGRPTFGASARYEREEGSHVLVGGLTVTLPAFNRGQDVRAESSARLERLRFDRAALAGAWTVRIRAMRLAWQVQHLALDAFERDALPAVADNDGLARRSYETGQISLVDWMVLRREALEVRSELLERRHAIAVTGIELEALAGVLR
jgi:cobalt-zinc-cadmium efflux system outer membrane protein